MAWWRREPRPPRGRRHAGSDPDRLAERLTGMLAAYGPVGAAPPHDAPEGTPPSAPAPEASLPTLPTADPAPADSAPSAPAPEVSLPTRQPGTAAPAPSRATLLVPAPEVSLPTRQPRPTAVAYPVVEDVEPTHTTLTESVNGAEVTAQGAPPVPGDSPDPRSRVEPTPHAVQGVSRVASQPEALAAAPGGSLTKPRLGDGAGAHPVAVEAAGPVLTQSMNGAGVAAPVAYPSFTAVGERGSIAPAPPTSPEPQAAYEATAAWLGTVPDGTAPDETAPDGAASDGTASDGTAPDGTAPDGTAPDGTAPDPGGWPADEGVPGHAGAGTVVLGFLDGSTVTLEPGDSRTHPFLALTDALTPHPDEPPSR